MTETHLPLLSGRDRIMFAVTAVAAVAAGVLGLTGFLLGFRALSSDLFRLHAARIDTHGAGLHWSHAPTLLGPAVSQQRFVPWAEVRSVVWREGLAEHEFRQLLATLS